MTSGPMYLTIQGQGETITMDLTAGGPVVPRGRMLIDQGLLTEIGEELARITELANKRSAIDAAETVPLTPQADNSHLALQQLGDLIFSHFFPVAIRQRLAAIASTDLFLRLDDQLVRVPWELAFDGQQFLMTRFRIGRQVMTQHVASNPPVRKDSARLRMLIIADPTESLPAAAEEADRLCDLLDTCDDLEVEIFGGKQLRKIDLLRALNTYDLVHYAGHACFDPAQPERSGWLLHDAVLSASELSKVARPPLLVFANACQAGATSRWQSKMIYEGQAFGIGSAFLLAGTQNYIGTFCVIHDTHSAAFAADFYRHFLQGKSLGEALAAARQKARQEAAHSGLLWASYMHYGEPTFRLSAIAGPTPAASEPGQQGLEEISTQEGRDAKPASVMEKTALQPVAKPAQQMIDELLRQRSEIDALLEECRQDVTLLFTDIQGSTAYFEKYGDLSGRLMIQRHNHLLFPIIEAHQGSIVKTIGDAIMASFHEPTRAVQAAMAMQRALRDATHDPEPAKQIHIRIGINTGQGLVETRDVFGDVVNVAARIESCALPDQILISAATYQRLPDTLPCRLLGTSKVKGKEAPIELYEVHWDEHKRFSMPRRGPGVVKAPENVFVLEVSRQAERLKLGAYERQPGGEAPPVKPYDDLTVSFATVQQAVNTMLTLLNRATAQRGMLEASDWEALQTVGKTLYEQLLTLGVREKLENSTAATLILYLDDTLVHIPWELLYDGEVFLCRRFNIGRIVSVPQGMARDRERAENRELRMLVVADPQGDLEAAAREGDAIQETLALASDRLQVEVKTARVRISDVKALLPQFDLLHYAGHADYHLQEPAQSGWLLADGKLPSTDIQQLGEVGAVPRLVFCNACSSGHTAEWQVAQPTGQESYGLAHAFLVAGVQHYIGTFWEIPDLPSSTFAVHFYRALAQGDSIGEALGHARQALVDAYGDHSIAWAGYVLYGDPTFCYLGVQEPVSDTGDKTTPAPPAFKGLREVWSALGLGKKRLVLAAGILLLLLVTGAVFKAIQGGRFPQGTSLASGYQALAQGDWSRAESFFQKRTEHASNREKSQGYTGLAAVAFTRGDYPQALDFATQAETLDAESAYSHVIRGHILWNQGRQAGAEAEYRTAIEKPHALSWQRAVAYDRLGRLAAARGQTDKALQQYNRALTYSQDQAAILANKAYLLDQLGQHQEALELYRRALQIRPDDPITSLLLQQAERRQQLARDEAKQQRIDRLVADLMQAYEKGETPAAVGDGWTSTPLTLALLPLQSTGTLPPRAGASEVLALSLTQALQASNRITVVEREILDKLLAELKLSTTDLVEAQAAVRLGHILAARIMAMGSVVRLGDEGQLSLRLIETETTRIKAVLTQSIEKGPMRDAVAPLSRAVLHKLRQAYPLQGRIVRVTPEGIILNIGAEQGVTPGVVMQVFGPEEPLQVDGKVVGYHRIPIGHLEVTRVEAQHALATMSQPRTGAFAPGSKVKEVVEE